MTELTSQNIAAWHRQEAKKHQDLAYFHKKTADTIEFGSPEEARKHRLAPNESANELTLEQFETALTEKGGRVNHLAARLGVSEDRIWDLLNDSQCKWSVGDRGFIRLKEQNN